MEADSVELRRCRDGEILEETRKMLDTAGIPYRVGSTATNFDISTIGTGSDAEVIVTVKRDDYESARTVLEREYLNVDLPEDHFLLTSSNEEIAEILGKPAEWSPFDVAHARRIARERGIDSNDIKKHEDERLNKLRTGKPASKALLTFGWIFSILGGLIGLGIAWSICYMKEKTPEGEFFTYDERSREIGKPMLVLAGFMTALAIVFRLTRVLS